MPGQFLDAGQQWLLAQIVSPLTGGNATKHTAPLPGSIILELETADVTSRHCLEIMTFSRSGTKQTREHDVLNSKRGWHIERASDAGSTKLLVSIAGGLIPAGSRKIESGTLVMVLRRSNRFKGPSKI